MQANFLDHSTPREENIKLGNSFPFKVHNLLALEKTVCYSPKICPRNALKWLLKEHSEKYMKMVVESRGRGQKINPPIHSRSKMSP